MKTCGDIVQSCVVIGHQRIYPLLVVELCPSQPDTTAAKMEILKRTATFNERLFAHERISKLECILVVPPGSLPRTSVRTCTVDSANNVEILDRRKKGT